MSSGSSSEKKGGEVKGAKMAQIIEKGILGISEMPQIPAAVKPYLVKAAPLAGKVAQSIENAIPFVQKYAAIASEYLEKLRPYRLDLLIPSFIGLIMCFFGGSYLTTIAAWEAFMMCGYDSTMQCVQMLMEDFAKVAEVSKKDDVKDDDGDGVADTLQISSKELVKRKTLLFLTTINPERLNFAIVGINAGFLAVVATLKMQFAKTITLGNAIGHAMEVPAHQYVLPVFEKFFPPEYKKWAWPLISYSIRSFSISVAWFVQRMISAFHSALRGGLMCSRNIMEYLTQMKIYEINHEESILDEIVGYALAALGLWFQLRLGFSVPFPLNVVLFPVTIVEYMLMWFISSK